MVRKKRVIMLKRIKSKKSFKEDLLKLAFAFFKRRFNGMS